MLVSGGAAIVASQGLRAAPSGAEYRHDIEIVRRTLALHPGLYRYQTPATLDQRFVRLERAFIAAGSPERRFLILSEFMATIRCGHSQCNPYNQSNGVAQSLFERATKLPFEFDWIAGRMVVLADRSGTHRLRVGTEILP